MGGGLNLRGEFDFHKMPELRAGDNAGINQEHLDKFGDRGDVEMFSQLPDYDESNGYDLSLARRIWRRYRVKFTKMRISHLLQLQNNP